MGSFVSTTCDISTSLNPRFESFLDDVGNEGNLDPLTAVFFQNPQENETEATSLPGLGENGDEPEGEQAAIHLFTATFAS